ncbi:hypothetical protein MD588_10050 [Photobacterium sp. SDRW27]|uniref:hypothetical protein n=1 Tax=Photobacterium obscurum TaxID=2829490 RepID=UPI0022437F8F|nr:hypothetical protein [Photobacterium obscurum]MCW8329147.1 hypothetical protein [Photobacterium obscurum]
MTTTRKKRKPNTFALIMFVATLVLIIIFFLQSALKIKQQGLVGGAIDQVHATVQMYQENQQQESGK